MECSRQGLVGLWPELSENAGGFRHELGFWGKFASGSQTSQKIVGSSQKLQKAAGLVFSECLSLILGQSPTSPSQQWQNVFLDSTSMDPNRICLLLGMFSVDPKTHEVFPPGTCRALARIE